jgi:transposase
MATVHCRKLAFSYAFLWTKCLNVKDIRKEMFPVYGGKCLSRKAVHNWVEKFSQGRSKVADDARPGRPVEIATEATAQRVEELIRADSVATALWCFHGLAYSIMHDRLKFRKVCAWWVPREFMYRGKMNRMDMFLQHLLWYADEGEYMLNRTVTVDESCIGASLLTRIKLYFSAMETSQFTFNQKARRLRHQRDRLCLPFFAILGGYS